MRVSLICLAVVTAAAIPAAALARDDAQLWTGGAVNVKLSENLRLSEELVGRFSDNRNGLYEIESNTLLGYRVAKNVTVWGGYTHDPNYSAGHFTVLEHRAREQVTFDNFARIGRGTLSGRLRLEQRWRDGGVEGTGWRFRPYAKLALPFQSGGKTMLVLSHESFINLNTTSYQQTDGEDRMRNLIAISTPISKHVAAEIGYLNQHSFVKNGPDNQDHVASMMLNFSF